MAEKTDGDGSGKRKTDTLAYGNLLYLHAIIIIEVCMSIHGVNCW